MLSRRRATALVSANRWDGGRLEQLVRPINDLPFRAEQLKAKLPTCSGTGYAMVSAGASAPGDCASQPLPFLALGQVTHRP
jgi:hypothetical protein